MELYIILLIAGISLFSVSAVIAVIVFILINPTPDPPTPTPTPDPVVPAQASTQASTPASTPTPASTSASTPSPVSTPALALTPVPAPVSIPYNIQDFVQYTGPDTDISFMTDSLDNCQKACNNDSSCLGFSRRKDSQSTGDCWLKKSYPNVSFGDGSYQTFTKPSSLYPAPPAAPAPAPAPVVSPGFLGIFGFGGHGPIVPASAQAPASVSIVRRNLGGHGPALRKIDM